MPCYSPIRAYKAPGGGVAFNVRDGYSDLPVALSCGQCIGCRLERSRQWAVRCVHEAQMHDRNCFITLTYNPENVPADGGLDVTHWQKFAKRLRKGMGPFRFLHCGEYGDSNYRPHYHAALFGIDFAEDRSLWKKHREGEIFTSPTLEKTWGQGFTTVGHLTWNSAAYVARYVMKKATGPQAREQYRRIDVETGEEYYVKPEYITMSRRPGLGSSWYDKYKKDVYPSDEVIHHGKFQKPPKFYDRSCERADPEIFELVKAKRKAFANAHKENSTTEKLLVREEVKKAQVTRLQRKV